MVVERIVVESFLNAGIARKQRVLGRGLRRRNLHSRQISSQFSEATNHRRGKLGEWDESGAGEDHTANASL